jgi:hypothetical protein
MIGPVPYLLIRSTKRPSYARSRSVTWRIPVTLVRSLECEADIR